MLIAFDRFVHRRLFNPVFLLVQKWFHVSRYHLLFAAETLVFMLFMLLGAFFLATGIFKADPLALLVGIMYVVITVGVVQTGLMARRLTALKEVYERFEERGFARPAVTLIALAADRKSSRLLTNPMVLCVWITSAIILASGKSLEPLMVAIVAYLSVTCVDEHLWDADDLDPRDREYLFHPQSQSQEK